MLLNFKMLEEIWFGKPIKYDHLHVLIVLHMYMWGKISWSQEMYALRYSSGVKDYKQWYNVKNYITSWYVIFNKDVL